MYCRRTYLATLAIACLTGIAIHKGVDVSMAIAGIVAAVAGSNSFEKSNIAKAEAGAPNVVKS
jgi:porphobilinogen deaminase